MDAETCTVLISAAGRRVALLELFRRSLAELGLRGRVLATDVTPLAAAWHAADQGFLVPRSDDPAFISAMIELCRREHIDLIIPTNDVELPVYAAARECLATAGTAVAVSAPEVISVANDKVATHAWLVDHGFPTVRQAPLAEVLAAPQHWPLPLVVKPRGGSSAVGVAVVDDLATLRAAARDGAMVAQSIAPGVEYTVDVFVDRSGRCRCAVPRRRLEVRAGEVSKAVTVRHPRLESLVWELVEALPGASGALNVQVFVTDGGDMSVIEINPRFCLLYTSPSPRDRQKSRMPSSA